jgi:hypothetical protein
MQPAIAVRKMLFGFASMLLSFPVRREVKRHRAVAMLDRARRNATESTGRRLYLTTRKTSE